MTPLPEEEMSAELRPHPEQEAEIRRRLQRDRSRITAWLLAAFVILMFAISMAKMMVNQ
jgi:hypothetical protein